jgi:hypothetical protein
MPDDRLRDALVIRARYLEAGYQEDHSSNNILGVSKNIHDQNGIRFVVTVKIFVGGGTVGVVTTAHFHGDFGEVIPSIMLGPSIQTNEETLDKLWFSLRADYALHTA